MTSSDSGFWRGRREKSLKIFSKPSAINEFSIPLSTTIWVKLAMLFPSAWLMSCRRLMLDCSEVAPTTRTLFLWRKLIQHFVCQAKLNSFKPFSSNSCQVSSFMSKDFFSLLSSAFFNPLWVRMAFILVYHLLKLMTPSDFWISNLIADIFTLTLLWYHLLKNNLYALISIVVNSGRPRDRINWDSAAKTNTRSLGQRKEENKIF